jgi:hypothetical protein
MPLMTGYISGNARSTSHAWRSLSVPRPGSMVFLAGDNVSTPEEWSTGVALCGARASGFYASVERAFAEPLQAKDWVGCRSCLRRVTATSATEVGA